MKRRLVQLMFAATVLCIPVTAQTADEIIAKNFAARGLERLEPVRSIILTGRLTGPGLDSPITVRLKRPHKYRMDMKPGGKRVTEVYDGVSAWRVDENGSDSGSYPGGGAHEVSGTALKTILDQSEFDSPLVNYKAKGHKVELVGEESVNDAMCFKLKITLRSGTVMHQYIDSRTFLEVREELIRPIDGGKAVEIEELVDDYRPVGGVLFPHLFDSNLKGTAEHYRLIIEKIDLNAAIDDSVFKMPPSKK